MKNKMYNKIQIKLDAFQHVAVTVAYSMVWIHSFVNWDLFSGVAI